MEEKATGGRGLKMERLPNYALAAVCKKELNVINIKYNLKNPRENEHSVGAASLQLNT